LLQVAVAVGIRRTVLGRAGGRSLEKEIVADRQQAGRVDEAGEIELADDGRRGRRRNDHRDLARLVDGDRGGGLGNREPRLHQIALGGDDAALAVEIEGAVAGIGEGAVGLQDLEKALTADRHVEGVAG
jgi:hypothetical protein